MEVLACPERAGFPSGCVKKKSGNRKAERVGEQNYFKKMKKIALILLVWELLPLHLYSQIAVVIEPAVLECHYLLTMLKDTVSGEKYKHTDRVVLRIGENSSQCFSYYKQWDDSLMFTPEGRKVRSTLFLGGLTNKDPHYPGTKIMTEYLYKNYPEGRITTRIPIRRKNNYLFEEEYGPQQWNIQDSTKTVMGYECRLATCHFRGRDYQAWFTRELPIPEGPWKFNGLPGLILEVYDTGKHYHFQGIEIRKEEPGAVTYYNFWEKEPVRTDRISFLRLADKDREEFAQMAADFKGKSLEEEKGAYDFMERDYHEAEQ